ncbi:hypothetical protein A1Q1_00314 [Trichosporon asahii var. asahii CBS 2479]|uniref:Uncharacterized protein n=1 Tax=Trichosporon asahii var. asahii (strain ATCC 90039 / CBS 2479 / JCM 2466 / KCTC 7840 / NBRC 103889/ NCYC 2677 / UAMH 7654) TaxID=1186058 RepID=J8TYX3_TRIAS|nr:hypothetical protein A1Q1_00314 [Trichosporon asahii var. asahii CBS 2479]EJT53000.1 hypothetical protein A1Q1_00314 [Trichosporon asahii var. asahii CBS 2479]
MHHPHTTSKRAVSDTSAGSAGRQRAHDAIGSHRAVPEQLDVAFGSPGTPGYGHVTPAPVSASSQFSHPTGPQLIPSQSESELRPDRDFSFGAGLHRLGSTSPVLHRARLLISMQLLVLHLATLDC